MKRFDVPAMVEDAVWTMKLGDYDRSLNRSMINDLFNGAPPYSKENAARNKVAINVNYLDSTKLAHDARRQFYNAFLKAGQFFSITEVDRGARHRREQYAKTITNHLNRKLKRSLPYYETRRSEFASLVLHGVGPSVWDDQDRWRPRPVGVEDVLFPSGTLVSMENVPFFAVFRSFSAAQLSRMTSGPKVDPGWNMQLVRAVINDIQDQALKFGFPGSDIYTPEKMSERYKEDRGLISTDRVPSIDCWDFFFWDDDANSTGWKRRIVLDATLMQSPGGQGSAFEAMHNVSRMKSKFGTRDQFLYTSGDRKYASGMGEIISIQFADLSAVAPFRYHSVRSLGFLLFAVCHIQNRLLCKVTDSVFEQLLQYFRVNNLEDAERALKIELFDKGFVDDSIKFVPQSERWQVNANLAQMGINLNRQIIGSHSSAFTQDFDFGRENSQKTATEVMAQVHSTTALVSAAISQAYEYAKYQYLEICRRFSRPNSRDVDIRDFRRLCLRDGVPEAALDWNCWDVSPEQIIGGGNKMLEMAINDKLMAVRNLFDPEPQRMILRDYTLSLTDDPGRARMLVPENPVQVTDSVHDAQLAAGSLMQGFPVAIKTGINHIEYVQTLLVDMDMVIKRIEGRGGMASPMEIAGLQNMAQHIAQHMQIIAQDPNEKQRVKQFGDALGQMINMVRGYEQRLQQAMQKRAQMQAMGGNGEQQAELQSKIQARQIEAQAKAANARESHAQRTSQRQAQFQMEMTNQAQRNEMELDRERQMVDIEMQRAVIDDIRQASKSKAQIIKESGKQPANKK